MTCDRYKMGYKDQRYAVVITGRDGKDFVLGWTEKANGGGLINMATLHPEFKDCNPRVIDLKPEQAIPDATNSMAFCICDGSNTEFCPFHDKKTEPTT